MSISVHSETGRLKKVIVHTPGREVSLVNPELKEELLFDDIIFESDARQEHLDMLNIFKTAIQPDGEIYEILDLALDVFKQEEVRDEFVHKLISRQPYENLAPLEKNLLALSPEELLTVAVEGTLGPDSLFQLHPAPNILFTRDLAAVAGNSMILSRPAKPAREREFLLMELIARYHPQFEPVRKNLIYTTGQQSIEGGDILIASENIVLIGMSERTSFSGLMTVASQLLEQNFEHVLAVDIPKKRSSMHLDTIFTFADKTECVVFPPAITRQSNNVVHLYKSNDGVAIRSCESLKQALEDCTGKEFTFIECGGTNMTDQFREQWTDGANVFALAPGVIVGYGRNTKTFNTLVDYGYRYLDQYEFIEEYSKKPFNPDQESKIAISFDGHELCRGRGGARCMTMPILRES